jgi:hypothetical protein
MTDCLCANVPSKRAGVIFAPHGEVKFTFHLDCPEHGITQIGEFRSMRPVQRRAWINAGQAPALRWKENVKIIEKAPDRRSALLEWTEYELFEEEEAVG